MQFPDWQIKCINPNCSTKQKKKQRSQKTEYFHLDSKATFWMQNVFFDPYCRRMLISPTGQGSVLDRDGIPKPDHNKMQENICSPCVTQSCPLRVPYGPQEPGKQLKVKCSLHRPSADWTQHQSLWDIALLNALELPLMSDYYRFLNL